MLTFLTALRVWIAATGIITIYAGIACWSNSNPQSRMPGTQFYTLVPEQVTPIAVRLFGYWMLSMGFVRMLCAYNIMNRHLYYATLSTYLLPFAEFGTELTVHQTMRVTAVPVAALLITGVSSLWMLMGLRPLEKTLKKQHSA